MPAKSNVPSARVDHLNITLSCVREGSLVNVANDPGPSDSTFYFLVSSAAAHALTTWSFGILGSSSLIHLYAD